MHSKYNETKGLGTGHRMCLLAFFLLATLWAWRMEGQGNAAPSFEQAKAKYEANTPSAEASWQFAQACFDKAEAATNKSERAEAAEAGINACRKALAIQSNSAPLHYFLGLNLGELAQTRGLSALKLVNQMEHEFLAAIALDAKFDHAGPERSLGMLYRDAPSIASIGNRTKARQHLQRAVELEPNFPENRLELIQSYLKWNERNNARQELRNLEQNQEAARKEFGGAKWADDWKRWEATVQA